MYPRQDVDLLIFLVQKILQIFDFRLQTADSLFQRFGISSRERSAAQFVASTALEANVGALGAAGSDTVTADLFASASITGLGDAARRTSAANLDHFHGQDTRHVGQMGRMGRRVRVWGCSVWSVRWANGLRNWCTVRESRKYEE